MSSVPTEAFYEDAARASNDTRTLERRGTVRGDLALFHRGLADLCRADVPLPRALRILQSDLERGSMAKEALAMADEIEQGVPLDEAYGRRDRRFSPVYRALVKAGISGGGALPDVLDEIAQHASQRQWILDRMRRTMAYPLVATGFVVLLGGFLLLFVGSPMGSELAFGAEVAPRPASSFETWAATALGVLAVGGIALFTLLRRPLDEGVVPRSLGYRLPLIGRLRTYAAKAQFAATMALLLRRAVPLPKALQLTAAASDDARIKHRIDAMAAAADSGSGLSDAVGKGELISPSLSWFLEAATDDRAAAAALDDIASIYRQRLERSAERVAVLAAPMAQLVVGLVVLGFALTYMTSSLNLSGAGAP